MKIKKKQNEKYSPAKDIINLMNSKYWNYIPYNNIWFVVRSYLTLKAQSKFAEDDTLKLILIFRKNKTWQFMWIVC